MRVISTIPSIYKFNLCIQVYQIMFLVVFYYQIISLKFLSKIKQLTFFSRKMSLFELWDQEDITSCLEVSFCMHLFAKRNLQDNDLNVHHTELKVISLLDIPLFTINVCKRYSCKVNLEVNLVYPVSVKSYLNLFFLLSFVSWLSGNNINSDDHLILSQQTVSEMRVVQKILSLTPKEEL